jgi:hypothetical protein
MYINMIMVHIRGTSPAGRISAANPHLALIK